MTERTQKLYQVTFHWNDGTTDKRNGWGTSPIAAATDAINGLGYGGGALAALDYWSAEIAKETTETEP